MMSLRLALPRLGHLSQVHHAFSCLKKHHNAEMAFDSSDPVVDTSEFEWNDLASSEFSHILGHGMELPASMPHPRGIGFVTRDEVDPDHASDAATRMSRTGFIARLNSLPICWHSKKQNSS